MALVERAIAALGGHGAVAQVNDSIAMGHMEAFQGNWVAGAEFVWKTANERCRLEYRKDQDIRVTTCGRLIGRTTNGRATRTFQHLAFSQFPPHLPALLLAARVRQPKATFISLGSETIGGRRVAVVGSRLEWDDDIAELSYQKWFFDEATAMPVRLEFRAASERNALDTSPVLLDFADYRQVSGLAVPFRIFWSASGLVFQAATLDSVKFNGGVPDSEFEIVAGGAR